MSFEPQELLVARNLVLATKKQTTYGTGVLDANFLRRPRFDPGAFAEIAKNYYADGDKAGKGHNWPTFRQEIMRDSRVSFSFDLTDFLAGWCGAFTFGAVQTSGAGPFTHLFTFLTATNIFPVTSVYLEDTADIKYKLLDLAIAELEISGGPSGPLQAKVTMVGSGKVFDGAVTLPAAITEVMLLGSDTDILIGAQAGAASIKERIRSWSVKFTNEIIPHRAPGGGLYSTFHKVLSQRCSVQLAIAAKDVDDVRTIFLADTIRELQINTNSGAAAQLNIKLPGMYYSAAQIGMDGKEGVWNVQSDENAGVIKSGGSNYAEYTAINGETTFLTAG